MPILIALVLLILLVLLFGPGLVSLGAGAVALIGVLAASAVGAAALAIGGVVLMLILAGCVCWLFWWAGDPQHARASQRAYEDNRGDTAGYLRAMGQINRKKDGTDGLIFRVGDAD